MVACGIGNTTLSNDCGNTQCHNLIHSLLCEICQEYAVRPSFSSSLNMPNHLSRMYTLRGMSIYIFRLHHDLDLGYTSSVGLKRTHLITIMDTIQSYKDSLALLFIDGR